MYELVRITGNSKDIDPGYKVRGSRPRPAFCYGNGYCFILGIPGANAKGVNLVSKRTLNS